MNPKPTKPSESWEENLRPRVTARNGEDELLVKGAKAILDVYWEDLKPQIKKLLSAQAEEIREDSHEALANCIVNERQRAVDILISEMIKFQNQYGLDKIAHGLLTTALRSAQYKIKGI